jgi:FecR protein
LNYVGKFDATISSDGPGAHSPTYVHVDHLPAHAPADAILVPDAQLLFHGDFTRSGVDLILSKDDREFVLHDYFKGEKHAALASPDGAHLTGDLVNALTGEVQYSQAGGPTNDHQVIGHVSKLQGSATAIRNGVSIILNNGDNVEKGDVVQSGSDSTLGVTFIDGTVFGLSSNARMVLNEMVYDPNGSNNSSLLSLVAGTITFVAGETAKHGDMKIDTPVATMGIRGTAVLVEIDFTVPGQGATPDAKFQVLVEPDGTTGSYILFDKTTLQPIAMVNLAGQQINISNGVISQSSTPLSPDVQKLITDVFSLKFSDANPNTKTTTAQTDTLNPELIGPTIQLANGTTATPIFLVTNPGGGNGPSVPNLNGGPSLVHIAGPPLAAVLDASGHPTTTFGLTELPGKTGDATDQDTIIGNVDFVDINPGDRPTVKVDFSSFVYQNAQHQNLTLNALQQQDIAATEIKLVVVPGPGNNNNGNAAWTYSLPDNAFDFLAAGETLTLTYNVRVDNNYAPLDEATIIPITITITGSNDAPVITSSAPTIAFSGGKHVSGGNLPLLDPDPVTGTKDATSGTLAFKDVDLTDTHTVSAPELTGAVGVLNGVTVLNGVDELPPGPYDLLKAALTASIGTDSTGTGFGTINWKLADLPVYIADFIPNGETLTLTYTVTLMDSQGAKTTQDVTVTITGTDKPAVVWIDTTASPSGGQWNDGTNWETGSIPTATDDVIIITNQLKGLTPVYPVTIETTPDNPTAAARSLTMNDYGPLFTNKPTLINQGILTVGLGGIRLKADSIIENDKSATISVAGAMEVLDQSSLKNYGQITLQGGGDFKDQSTIKNFASGTIEVSGDALHALDILVDIANCGLITVDTGAMMALNGGTIDGGTVTINGTLELEGGAVLKNGSLGNSGQINVSGTGNALHHETVTANHALEVQAGAALTIDLGSVVANTGTVTIDSTALLTLNNATVTGGIVTNKAGGTIDLTGAAVLKSGSLDNSGQINVSGAGNTLDAVTVALNNALEVLSGSLTIDQGSTVTSSGGSVTVDGTATLTLNDATVTGGTVTNEAAGTIDLTGAAALKNGSLGNSGQITVSSIGNTLDGEAVTNDGAAAIDITGALTLKGAASITNVSGNTATVESAGSLTLQDTSHIVGGLVTNKGTLDLQNTSALKSGTLANTGQVNVSGLGNTFDGEAVTNNDAGAIEIAGVLTLLNKASISNGTTSNAETVEFGASLTLQDTSHIIGGTVSIAGTLDLEGTSFLQNGILTNTGQVNVFGTGNTLDGETVANNGAIDITGALTLKDITSISNGLTNAETVESAGSLTLQDTSSISGGQLTNLGNVYIEASLGATFDGVSIDNTGGGTIHVDTDIGPPPSSPATLILDNGTTIKSGTLDVGGVGTLEVSSSSGATLSGVTVNNSNIVQIDKGSVLTLSQTTITSGTVTDDGTIHVTGNSAIDGAALNSGQVTVDSGKTLTLDGTTVIGTTITGAIEVDKTYSLTLDNVSLTGTLTNNGTVTVDSSETLTLNSATITGGTITDYGTIHITADSTIDDAALGNTHLTVDSDATLTLQGGAIVTGGTLTDSGTVKVETSSGATLDGVTVNGSGHIQVDSGPSTLILDDDTTVTGGTLTVGPVGTLAIKTAEGATLDGVGVTNNDLIEVFAGSHLTLDGDTIVTNNGTLTVDDGATLTLDHATINDGTINDGTLHGAGDAPVFGSIDVTGSSTIRGVSLNYGGVTVEPDQILTLDDDTLNGTTITADTTSVVKIDANTTLTLNGATFTGGSVHDDGLIDVTHDSTINSDLSLDGGQIKVEDNATLTLGHALSIGVADTVTLAGSKAILVDAAGLSLAGGTIAGSGDLASDTNLTGYGTVDIPLDSADHVTANAGKLEFTNAVDATAATSFDIAAAAESILKFDAAVGTATVNPTITFEGSDDGAGVLDLTKISLSDFHGVIANFDEGEAIDVQNAASASLDSTGKILTVLDSQGNSLGTIDFATSYSGDTFNVSDNGAITVDDLAVTTDSTTATQGATIHVTAVTDDGTSVIADATYDWQVSQDGGKTWVEANGTDGQSSYTLVEADEGQQLRLVTTLADDRSAPESTTVDFGTVQEIAGGDLVATLSSTTAQQGAPIRVEAVTDGGVVVTTGITYAWQHYNGTKWVTFNTDASYTPVESDEGKVLQLVVTYADASGTESSTYNLGMPNDLVATFDSMTAQQGLPIHVAEVTDGGTPVSHGVTYAWQVFSDNQWTTVGTGSSFTPVAADAGEQLQVVVTYKDSGESESTTDSFGTVAPAKEWLGGNHDWQTTGRWNGLDVPPPTSSDNAVVDASGTYTVKISQGGAAHSLVVNDSGATVEIVRGNTLTLGGDLTIDAGQLHIDSGATLQEVAASATITGAFTDNGTIESAGGKLEIASAVNLAVGKFKIDTGNTLQLDHGDALGVVFSGSGELILKDPTHFIGTISDSGGSLTSGDVVDLAGFDAAASVNYLGTTSGGIVTVTEGNAAAVLLVGANSTHWSKPVSDGHGGILIHDPPDDAGGQPAGDAVTQDPPAAPSQTIVATAPNQTLTGAAASDNFVFNFASVSHDTVTNFHPATDTLQFTSPIFANALAALNAVHDDGHGNTVIAIDGHDTVTLNGVLKAQLHATDFHIV